MLWIITCSIKMAQSEYDALFMYLSNGVYPSDDVNKKRILRRKAQNFKVDNGELFYIGGKTGDKPRRVIKTEEERRWILENCHGQTEGILLRFCYFCVHGIIWKGFKMSTFYIYFTLLTCFNCRRPPWKRQNPRKSFLQTLLGRNEQWHQNFH